MTDRELLELAAKAAGMELNGSHDYRGVGLRKGPHNYWNPLAHDGEALRLAVQLGLNVYIYPKDRFTMCESDEGIFYDDAKFGGTCDPYAATRRSIVRAAAKIGSAL